MPGAHSRLSPSSAHRWRRCPGAPRAEEGLPDTSGFEAAEGTAFHHFAALCLEFWLEPEDFLGKRVHVPYTDFDEDGNQRDIEHVFEFDGEMADHMHAGLAFLRARMHKDCLVFVEKKVDLGPWCGPGQFGTSDCGIVDLTARRITVFDWKYGQGIPVSPVENDQAILYALGFWHSFARHEFDENPDDIEVDIFIEQPRAPGGGGMWTTTMRRLLKTGKKVKEEAEATQDPDAPRIAGDKQCRFCKRAAKGCDALDEFLADSLGLRLDNLHNETEPETLTIRRHFTGEARSALLANRKLIERVLDGLHDEALRDALAGEAVPGLKAVLGRKPARKFRPSEMRRIEFILSNMLGDSVAYERSLLSPTAAEKKMGKRVFEAMLGEFVTQGSPKPSLVPVSDNRESIEPLDSRLDSLQDDDTLI